MMDDVRGKREDVRWKMDEGRGKMDDGKRTRISRIERMDEVQRIKILY